LLKFLPRLRLRRYYPTSKPHRHLGFLGLGSLPLVFTAHRGELRPGSYTASSSRSLAIWGWGPEVLWVAVTAVGDEGDQHGWCGRELPDGAAPAAAYEFHRRGRAATAAPFLLSSSPPTAARHARLPADLRFVVILIN
jgi:hypothetical protein